MCIETELVPRYCDTDAGGHINNTAVAEWLEAGRIDLLVNRVPVRITSMLRRIEIDYLQELRFRHPATIRTCVKKVGKTSVTSVQEIWQKGQCCVEAIAVDCCFDRTTGRPAPVPASARAGFLEFQCDEA